MTYTHINRKAGFVYVILDTEDNSRKLGKSKNVARRIQAIQTGNPHKLIVEYCLAVKNMAKAESSLHLLFAAKRLRKGEWFMLDDTDLVLLQKVFSTEISKTEYKQLESLGLR